MLSRRLLTNTYRLQKYVSAWRNINVKRFSENKEVPTSKQNDDSKLNPTLGDFGSKYQVFRDEDSETILDVIEERRKYASSLAAQQEVDPFEGLNLERGKAGVFDLDDLVTVLKRENAENLFVAAVPPEVKYVSHICVVSGKSQRHMLAIAQFVRRVFKQKMNESDLIPRLEGANSKDWVAVDLGNIALHIFSREARAIYDIDSLWSVGPDYDSESKKEDPIVAMLEQHSMYLRDLEPAN